MRAELDHARSSAARITRNTSVREDQPTIHEIVLSTNIFDAIEGKNRFCFSDGVAILTVGVTNLDIEQPV